jgi:hypothetical protein
MDEVCPGIYDHAINKILLYRPPPGEGFRLDRLDLNF